MTSTLLLVEDDRPVREALGEVLTDEGYQVAAVSNGLEALGWLRSHPAPAVILLDLMMPVMNGYQFRQEQQRDPALSPIPVFVLSAGALGQVADLAPARVFKKPLELDDLLAALEPFRQPHP